MYFSFLSFIYLRFYSFIKIYPDLIWYWFLFQSLSPVLIYLLYYICIFYLHRKCMNLYILISQWVSSGYSWGNEWDLGRWKIILYFYYINFILFKFWFPTPCSHRPAHTSASTCSTKYMLFPDRWMLYFSRKIFYIFEAVLSLNCRSKIKGS